MPEINQQLNASLAQYNEFLHSFVWLDIASEVNIWLEDVRNQLENVADVEELRRYQGIAEACRYFLALPEEIINTIESRRSE